MISKAAFVHLSLNWSCSSIWTLGGPEAFPFCFDNSAWEALYFSCISITESCSSFLAFSYSLCAAAAKAFKENNPEATVFQEDCQEVLKNAKYGRNKNFFILDQTIPATEEVDLLCGGPSCQVMKKIYLPVGKPSIQNCTKAAGKYPYLPHLWILRKLFYCWIGCFVFEAGHLVVKLVVFKTS